MDSIVVELATELNRHRSLTDRESRWLEASLRREERKNGNKREFWTRSDDSRLKRFVARDKKPRDIARLLGRTEQAVWCRIKFLRHRGQIEYYRPEWAKLGREQEPKAIPIAAE